MGLKIQSVKVGVERTNCYVVSQANGETIVVDPGEEVEKIMVLLANVANMKLRYVLLTHGHFDHVGAVDGLKRAYPDTPVMLSENDERLYLSVPEQGVFVHELLPQPKAELTAISDGEFLPFGDDEIEVIATPGHTPGSVCFRVGDNLFSGDTLFYHTIGRTDLPFSNVEDMRISLDTLVHLEGEMTVHPGHGKATTMKEEREHNSYL